MDNVCHFDFLVIRRLDEGPRGLTVGEYDAIL